MMSFMSKKKKFKFKVHLELVELASVPFVTGVLFSKVRLHDGGSYIDYSQRKDIRSNTVVWNAEFDFPCKMTASANTGVLDPCICRISVRKEMRGGRSHQKLGFVDLNLAQFAGSGQQTRRYLLEGYDAKHRQDNSNIKIVVELSLIAGDPVFKVPSTFSMAQQGEATVSGLTLESGEKVTCDDRSEGSMTSISSGFSSLNRKGRLEGQAPDVPEAEPMEQEGTLGHSRSASYVSQQSRASGYSSLTHSRQSSVSNEPGGHNRTPSLGSTLERRRKLEESGKECLDATRVDAEALVQQLIESTDLGVNDLEENSGLQMVVQKDGTMALR
ncbi:EEIG family member 2-like isoform X2 [Littorina saxatilis]|uniref:EEIG family member 2-like isoform X2 n=1 Tax=Littorina saxatilis TaxID=31220 RepID=UPI0038B699D4